MKYKLLVHIYARSIQILTSRTGRARTDAAIPKLQNRKDPENGPPLDPYLPCNIGWRNIIVEHGPEAFAKAVHNYPGRICALLKIAKETSYALAKAYNIECWGGATFEVATQSLYEDSWERLVRKIAGIILSHITF